MGVVAAATLEGGEEEADTTARGTMMTTVVDGVGMVAAATLEGGGEEADTTTRGTMMTTVVDGLPVPTRKLNKSSKDPNRTTTSMWNVSYVCLCLRQRWMCTVRCSHHHPRRLLLLLVRGTMVVDAS